jgi:hypothetical protein
MSSPVALWPSGYLCYSEDNEREDKDMARVIVSGPHAKVDLTVEPTEGGVIATCVGHTDSDGWPARASACDWTATYDTMDDATEYAADHADRGTR